MSEQVADAEPPAPVVPASAVDPARALDLLRTAEIELEGLLVEASNATMRGFLSGGDVRLRCVYKPVRGERPLWDFPDGTLAGREVAAYEVSRGAGWDVVPPTVLRDGPLGPGACQLWIDTDEDGDGQVLGFVPSRKVPDGWLGVAAARGPGNRPYTLAHADDPRLVRMAVFDVVVNNADRKGGHVLLAPDGHLYGVDHGVCFHTEDKLRTVLWGWAGEPLPAGQIEVLRDLRSQLGGELGKTLATHLTAAEVDAVGGRIDALLAAGTFPQPGQDWPALPWPPI